MSSFDLAYTKTLDLEIFKEIGKVSEYLCPLCTGVYYNPVVDHCGHVFCRECIKYWLGSIGKTKICPISKTQYDSNIEDQIIHPLTVIQIIIEKLEVKCKHRCSWEGKLSDMLIHIKEECPNSIVDCKNKADGCLAKFIRTDSKSHEENCDYRPINCENCDENVPIISLGKHLEVCPKVRIDCPQKCQVVIERMNLEKHTKDECENTKTSCVFEKLGCGEIFLRKLLNEHNLENINKHNHILVDSILQIKEKVENILITINDLNKNLNTVNNNNNCMTETMYEQLIDGYNKKNTDEENNLSFMGNNINNNLNNRGIVPSRISSRITNLGNINMNKNALINNNDRNCSSGEKNIKGNNDSLIQKKRERNQSSSNSNLEKNNSNAPTIQSLLTTHFKAKNSGDENKFNPLRIFQQDELDTNLDDVLNSNSIENLKNKNSDKERSINSNPNREIQNLNSPNNQSQLLIDQVNISKGIIVTNNKAVNNSMTKNEHKFIFANLIMNKTDCEWKVVINKKSSWIGVGCCIKEIIIANNYKFASYLKHHGCFMISSNGYIWNTNNIKENNCMIPSESTNSRFEIESGDVIKYVYKSTKNELTVSVKEFKINLSNVFSTRDGHLVPCVVLLNYGDEIMFTY